MPQLAEQSGGDVAALAGLAVDDQTPARRQGVEALAQLINRDVDRARDRPAVLFRPRAHVHQHHRRLTNQSGEVLDMHLRVIAPRDTARDETGHVHRVLG
jgi:hypothetical protein